MTWESILERGSPDCLISEISLFQSPKIKNELVKHMQEFCRSRVNDNPVFIVSLSGGVDSMVIASIIKGLKCRFVCLHNNRIESIY